MPAEELDPRVSNKEGETETEGAHAAPQAEQLPLEGSSEATGPMTVEDALKEGPADIDSLVNYTRNGSNFFIELGEQKNEFVAEAAVHVKRCFKKGQVCLSHKRRQFRLLLCRYNLQGVTLLAPVSSMPFLKVGSFLT